MQFQRVVAILNAQKIPLYSRDVQKPELIHFHELHLVVFTVNAFLKTLYIFQDGAHVYGSGRILNVMGHTVQPS